MEFTHLWPCMFMRLGGHAAAAGLSEQQQASANCTYIEPKLVMCLGVENCCVESVDGLTHKSRNLTVSWSGFGFSQTSTGT